MADGRVVIDVLLNDDDAISDVDHLNNRLNGLEQSGQNGALGIGKIVTALGLVALGTKIIDTVKGSIQSAFGRIDTMESFERVMTTITGSTEKTKKALDSTRDAVTGTAYGLDVAARGVQNFVTRGIDIDKATERIAAWGDAVAFYGNGSNEELASVADALAKMSTKGKVEMDQLNRLFDVGIDAVGMYAQATNRDAASVQKDLSAGKISAEQFIETVTVAMMEGTNGVQKIAGAAKEAGASWGGSFDNMRAAVTRGVVNIIQTIDTMLTSNGLPDMRSMIAEFGKTFERTLNIIAEKIPVVAEKINTIYNILKPWLPLLASVAVGVGSVILGIATFNTVKGYILAIKAAFLALNGTIWANPITWVVAAIIAGALLVYMYWEPISGFFKELWGKVKEYGLAVWDWLKGAWQSTVDFFINIWSSISTFFSDLWGDSKESAISIWGTVKEVWNSTVDWFKSIWESITDFFVGLWDGIVGVALAIWDKVTTKWNEIVGLVTTIFAPMISFYNDLWATISNTALKIWDNISNALGTIWDNIVIIADSAWTILKNVILGPVLLLIDLLSGNFEEFKSHLTQIWDNIKEAASNIWGALKEIVLVYITTLIDNALLIWQAFKDTLSGYWEAIKQTAINIWTSIVDFIVSKIESFSVKIESIMQIIKVGIDTAWRFIENVWLTIIEKIVNSTGVDFELMRDKVMMVLDAIKQTIDTIWNFIRETFQNALSFLKALVTGDFEGMKTAVKKQMGLIKETVSYLWSDIKEVFTRTLQAVVIFVKEKFQNMKENAIQKMKDLLSSSITTWKNIKKAFTDALINIVKTVISKFAEFKQSSKNKMNETKQTIQDIWKKVVSFFKNSNLKDIGKNIIDGLIAGIKSKISAVSNAVKDVTNAITGKIKSILQIHSPSRWMRDEIGVNLMKGFEVGVDKEKASVINKADESAQWMKPNVKEFINPLRGVSLPLSYNLSSLKGIERNLQLTDSQQSKNNEDQTSVLKEVQAILNIAGYEAKGLLKFFTQEQSKERQRTNRQFKGRLT